MVRIIFILLIGAAAGYSYGFRDAKRHDETVVSRVLDRLGGDARQYSKHGPDAALKAADN